MDYRIAIPSIKRAKTIKDKTINYLAKTDIDFSKVDLFLSDGEELPEYKKSLADYPINFIITNQKHVNTQRNFIVNYYKENQLVLGPFQGPIACTRIRKSRGVCGASWQQAQTLIVPDVEKFPGHIACSSLSKSEIVVPIIRNNSVVGVLDVDSELLDQFDEVDKVYLEMVVEMVE